MEYMTEFSDKILPQATRAFTFIQHQLRELTNYCKLQNGPVSPDCFLKLENSLHKILHEIRAARSPPPKKPVKSDFDIVRLIASGSYGTVYQVRHKQTGQDLALKEIKLVEDERHYVLMERDVLIFLEHPLIISISCSFETESHLYMAMEYVGGGDCKSLLKKHSRFSVKASRFYIAELVLAVEYIHSFGVIHRDLKPDNLLMSATGHLKVADFGISKVGSVNMAPCLTEKDCKRVAREFTDEDSCGTPLFVAPEVLQYEAYGKPVDWWSTGIILFNVLTGSMPFSDSPVTWTNGLDEYTDIVINDDIHWPESGDPLPNDARDLISRFLEKDPVKRLGTRGAFEVKEHPFFQGVDWTNLLKETAPYVPVMEEEEEANCFPVSEPDQDGVMKVQPESPADRADFTYVAFRFNEEYGNPMPLSPIKPMTHFPSLEKKGHSEEEQDTDGWHESSEEEQDTDGWHESSEEEQDTDGWHESSEEEQDTEGWHESSEEEQDTDGWHESSEEEQDTDGWHESSEEEQDTDGWHESSEEEQDTDRWHESSEEEQDTDRWHESSEEEQDTDRWPKESWNESIVEEEQDLDGWDEGLVEEEEQQHVPWWERSEERDVPPGNGQCDHTPSRPPHHTSAVQMDPVEEGPNNQLLEATWDLMDIQHQLSEQTEYCEDKLQNGPVSPNWFLELENNLQKILHETRKASSPTVERQTTQNTVVIVDDSTAGYTMNPWLMKNPVRRFFYPVYEYLCCFRIYGPSLYEATQQ